jgi:uncharacterized OsmC-like protein
MTHMFKAVYDQSREVFAEHPEKASVAFEAESTEQDGFYNRATAREFTFEIDEPAELGGTNRGANPVELALASLASCQSITYRLYAAVLGIPIDRISVKAKGGIDLRGFLDVDRGIRPGFKDIDVTVAVDSPASDHDLQRLKDAVDRCCPVLDLLHNPVPVSLTLERAGTAEASAAE